MSAVYLVSSLYFSNAFMLELMLNAMWGENRSIKSNVKYF